MLYNEILTRSHQSYVLFSLKKFSLFIVLIFLTISCSQQSPTKRKIEDACRQEIALYVKNKPLKDLEERFLVDQKTTGRLSLDKLIAIGYQEESSSATTTKYMYEFEFQDKMGKPITLDRSANKTAQKALYPQVVKAQVHCKVVWNLFKGRVVKSNIETFLVAYDQQK